MKARSSMNIHRAESVKIKSHDSSKGSVWRELVINGEGFQFLIILHGRDGQDVLAVHETSKHDCCSADLVLTKAGYVKEQ